MKGKLKLFMTMFIVTAMVLSVITIISCKATTEETTTEETTTEEMMEISLVLQFAYHPWFIPMRLGAEDAGEEFGIIINWLGSSNFDLEETINIIDAQITIGVKGLGVMVADPPMARVVTEKARDMGIVVISANNTTVFEGYDGFVGVSPQVVGKQQGEELVKIIQGQGEWAELHGYRKDKIEGKVAYLIEWPGVANQEYRIEGAKEVLSGYEGIIDLGTYDTQAEITRSYEVASDIITANPDITAFICSGSAPSVGSASAVEDRDLTGKVIVVGMDLLQETLEQIKEGIVAVTFGQDPYMQGYKTVELLAKNILYGEEIPLVTETNLEKVTLNNID